MANQDKHCYQCKHRHKLYCEKPCNGCNGNPSVVKGKDNFTEIGTTNKNAVLFEPKEQHIAPQPSGQGTGF